MDAHTTELDWKQCSVHHQHQHRPFRLRSIRVCIDGYVQFVDDTKRHCVRNNICPPVYYIRPATSGNALARQSHIRTRKSRAIAIQSGAVAAAVAADESDSVRVHIVLN